LVIFDGPGVKSKRDTYNHSYVMRHGLTHDALNGIFIFVEYNPRVGSIMAEDFWEVAKMLKPEYFNMVVLIATKMDQFKPGKSFPNRGSIEQEISTIFEDDHDVRQVLFSDESTCKDELFQGMYNAIQDKPSIQLEYSEVEFLQHFDLKAWKGREMHDLYRTKNLVQGLTSGFLEGLSDLEKHRNDYPEDEFQDCVFSAIQQSRNDLEELVMSPFEKRNRNQQMEFDDYASWIEMKKIVDESHSDVRNEAKRLLNINPDDTSNWRNALRRCQHCGEVWVKVEGCDGTTTCGLIPSEGDPYGEASYFSYVWSKAGEYYRPKKVSKRKRGRVVREKTQSEERKVGCGREIDWKNQAILPLSEVDALFNTQELQQFLNSFIVNTGFVSSKNKKEGDVPVFSELDSKGRDM